MPSFKHRFAIALALLALSPGAGSAVDVRYMAFGDSITAAFGFDQRCNCDAHECRQLCGYPRRLKARLVAAGIDAGVINEGVGGERTSEGVSRFGAIIGPGYDTAIIMEGTNDISRNVSPETTMDNLLEIGRKAAAKGVETVYATLIPRIPQATVDPENVINADLAAGIRELAFSTGRRLADPFEVFSTTPNLFDDFYVEPEPNPLGHPNADGFDLLTDIFFEMLMGIDNVPPVVGKVEPANGAVDVAPLSAVRVRLYDFGSGLDAGASVLRINGDPVGFSSSSGLNWQDLSFFPEVSMPAEVDVRVESRDLRFNTMAREVSRFTVDQTTPGACVADDTTLCIDSQVGDERFKLTLHYETALGGGQEGDAEAIPLASIGLRRGGLFSFFSLDNPEVLVKVLDGCAINNKFWVFVAPTTTLGYELRITDTVAALQGAPREDYELIVTNTDGIDAPPVSDTAAFPTCEFVSP